MATNVAAWLGVNPTGDPAGANRRYILIGDFNASSAGPFRRCSAAADTQPDPPAGRRDAYSYNRIAARVSGPRARECGVTALVKSVAHLHVNADEPPRSGARQRPEEPDGHRRVLRPDGICRGRSRPNRDRVQPAAVRFR
jgi:hypothetical protein